MAGDGWQGELTNRRKDDCEFQTSLTISPIVESEREAKRISSASTAT